MVGGQTTIHLASILITVCLRLQCRERFFRLGNLIFWWTTQLGENGLDPEISTTGLSKLAILGHLRVQLQGIGASKRGRQDVLDADPARVAMVLRLEPLCRILMRSHGFLGRVEVFSIVRAATTTILL